MNNASRGEPSSPRQPHSFAKLKTARQPRLGPAPYGETAPRSIVLGASGLSFSKGVEQKYKTPPFAGGKTAGPEQRRGRKGSRVDKIYANNVAIRLRYKITG